MNNKMNSKKPYDVFLLEFFIALVCAALGYLFITLMTPSSDEVVFDIFLYFFYRIYTQCDYNVCFLHHSGKASSYYSRYLLLALLMPPFLIPLLATLFDLIYLNSWHDAIDTLVEYYLTHGILACILGVVQLVLAAICLP